MIKVRVHLENPEGKVIVRTLTFVAPPYFNFSAKYTILSRQNTILFTRKISEQQRTSDPNTHLFIRGTIHSFPSLNL